MTTAEALRLVAYLEAAYVRELAEPSRIVYAEELSRYPFDVAQRAMRHYVQTASSEWFPPVGVVVGAVRAAMPRPVGALRDPALQAELESGDVLSPEELAERAQALRASLPPPVVRGPAEQSVTPGEGNFHTCGGTFVITRYGVRECGLCGAR